MLEVEETVRIDAPVAEVFEYMDRPENQPEITPSLTHSETLEELSNGGKRVAYTYTMAGIDLDGEIEAVEYDPEAHILWEMSGDLSGEIEWTFTADGDETVVTYVGRYEIPIPVLDAVVKPFVRRYNERELRTTLENLKTRVEAGAAASA
ncbi:SRPBCC family protein [Salinirubrum litoreum]|uniref:SRPBCC family protein n=1 Tax=Salinirubrum litoreum TaxID=1126234 RepID=A0ABD5RGC8_9EURY|nr:SRPBCC family protein [Salinirubrum litoreum]